MSSSSAVAAAETPGPVSEFTTSKVHIDPETFQPCYMFFYGSLMDPDVLQQVARLPSPPELQPGWISGWEMRMWGPFPTLVPAAHSNTNTNTNTNNATANNATANTATTTTGNQPGGQQESSSSSSSSLPSEENTIRGMAWKLTTYAQFVALQGYESPHYEPRACTIRTGTGTGTGTLLEPLEGEGPCLTFAWSGSPDSPDLSEGRFDLALYQRTVKPDYFFCSSELELESESEPESPF